MSDPMCARLLRAVEAQQVTIVEQGKQNAQQSEQIALLVQAVVLLLGEEAGSPVREGDEATDPERVDLDGNPY
jgi:hypothetical protein